MEEGKRKELEGMQAIYRSSDQGSLGLSGTLTDQRVSVGHGPKPCGGLGEARGLEPCSPDAQLTVLPAVCAASMEWTGCGSSDHENSLQVSVVRPLHVLFPLSEMLFPGIMVCCSLSSSRSAETCPHEGFP